MAACAALFVGISLATAHWWILQCGSAEASIQESIQKEIGVFGKPEYAPPGIRFPMVVDPSIPAACLLNSPRDASASGEPGPAPAWDGNAASCDSSGWNNLVLVGASSDSNEARNMPEKRWIAGVAKHPGYLILRLRYYPAWSVKVNEVPVTARPETERGLMAVPVPQGDAMVSVDWTTTSDVVAGRLVSGVALLLITGLFLFERKGKAGSR
jgi:hypothetical protein